MRIAVFPGSFDPVTVGHLDLIIRASRLFDRLVVAVGNNLSKHYLFSQNQRIALIRQNVAAYPNVKVVPDRGLTVNLLRKIHSNVIVRGIRNYRDLIFERAVASMNHHLDPKLETVFLLARPEYQDISSRILKETFHFGGDVSSYVPGNVLKALKRVRSQYEK